MPIRVVSLTSFLRRICERLADEGWAEEVALMGKHALYELNGLKAARKPQKLTDHGAYSVQPVAV